jgi:hypothetical protein
MKKLRALAAALILLALAGPVSEGAAQECIPPRAARQMLETGQIVPFPEALRRAGLSPERLVGRPLLCRSGGGYVYQLRVLGPAGRVRVVEIPAG